MRIIITIKDKKDVDSTVDKVLDIGNMLMRILRDLSGQV